MKVHFLDLDPAVQTFLQLQHKGLVDRWIMQWPVFLISLRPAQGRNEHFDIGGIMIEFFSKLGSEELGLLSIEPDGGAKIVEKDFSIPEFIWDAIPGELQNCAV